MKNKIYLKAAKDYIKGNMNFSCLSFQSVKYDFKEVTKKYHQFFRPHFSDNDDYCIDWWGRSHKTKKDKLAASLALLFMHEMENNPIS